MTAKPLARLTMRLACAALIVGAFLNLSDSDLQVQAQHQAQGANELVSQSDVKTPDLSNIETN